MEFFANALRGLAEFVASTGTMLCSIIILDEPKMPEELIK